MSEQDWAPEPWELQGDDCIVAPAPEGHYSKTVLPIYYDDYGGTFSCGWRVEKKNLPRIIACVNACAGIPTEVLERDPHYLIRYDKRPLGRSAIGIDRFHCPVCGTIICNVALEHYRACPKCNTIYDIRLEDERVIMRTSTKEAADE